MPTEAFQNYLEALERCIKETAQSIASSIDRITFSMLVDCLKSNDAQAVIEAIDQLAKEGRPVAIAPLYFVSKAHPNVLVCQKAHRALNRLVSDQEISSLVQNKNLTDSVKILVEKYGHYRNPP